MNQLKNAQSLYLKQHADNPVDWQEWSEAALTRARQENKPVLLSIGYSACHWCHVMAHESFEDTETAKLINDNFIAIKVDREERPDIDLIYQQVLAVTGEPGGWPLTAFLTPKAEAFFGGTYFPPKPMYGRPSFKDILKGVSDSWASEQDKIEYNVAAISQALKEEARSKSGDIPNKSALDKSMMKLISGFDPKHGGFGSEPKFPQVPLVNFVWQYSKTSQDDIFRKASLITLDNICQGGIYDHVGGGFFRYATDERWFVPHFEKMLYDNALIIPLLCDAYMDTKNRLYKTRVFETIDFLLRDMKISNTDMFAAALDADSDGREGEYYIWSKAEVDLLLGIDALEFNKIYDVTEEGNWDEHVILNRLQHQGVFAEKKENKLRENLETLKTTRAQRPTPTRDNKVLTDWNAMTVVALAKAGETFDQKDWIEAAHKLYESVKRTLFSDDQKGHCLIDDQITSKALLDDYVWMIKAALKLYKINKKEACLQDAVSFYGEVKDLFKDQDGGCFYTASTDGLPARPKTINDTAVPSGNAVLITILIDLALITEDETYKDDLHALITTFAGEIDLAPYAMGEYYYAILKFHEKQSLVCAEGQCKTAL